MNKNSETFAVQLLGGMEMLIHVWVGPTPRTKFYPVQYIMFMKENVILWYTFFMPPVDSLHPFSLY